MASVFIGGGTGFLGRRLIGKLLDRQHTVTALVRPESAAKLPPGTKAAPGNPLDADTFQAQVAGADTYVHLIGVTKPAPWKEREFRAIDLVSLQQAAKAASAARIAHFVFVSVAQPAPVMGSYIQVRQECETILASTGIPATVLRPWYVLGPGRTWPLLLAPFYRLMETLGSDGARRLGLVTIDEMTRALVWAVENPGSRILEVPSIREIGFRK